MTSTLEHPNLREVDLALEDIVARTHYLAEAKLALEAVDEDELAATVGIKLADSLAERDATRDRRNRMRLRFDHPHATYTARAQDGSTWDVLPTPLLLSNGSQPVEAYEQEPPSERYPAIWRQRDDLRDPAGTRYVSITVERKAGR